jgi:tRNA (cmo5U34)-methyltransferase
MSGQTSTNFFKKQIALEYERSVHKMLHHYAEMLEAIFDPVDFPQKKKIHALDLGLGTGNLTQKIFRRFPNAIVTAIEISPDMIQLAKEKLRPFKARLQIIEGDFSKIELPKNHFDLVVSCMSLHHIAQAQTKMKFYKRLFSTLRAGGIFSSSDPIQCDERTLTKYYENKMETFIKSHHSKAKSLLQHIRKEDFPERVSDHLRWLKLAGFKQVHLVWQHWNYAVISGRKG